jgi:UDP-N-acetylglucosamine acyltransferase
MEINMIHQTAIVSPDATIGEGVNIGAYSIIGEDVTIGKGTWIGPHVVVDPHVIIGPDAGYFNLPPLAPYPRT